MEYIAEALNRDFRHGWMVRFEKVPRHKTDIKLAWDEISLAAPLFTLEGTR
jgi:hypothetical protein